MKMIEFTSNNGLKFAYFYKPQTLEMIKHWWAIGKIKTFRIYEDEKITVRELRENEKFKNKRF